MGKAQSCFPVVRAVEHAVSAMLRSTSRPTPCPCRRSTADTALMCPRQLSPSGLGHSLGLALMGGTSELLVIHPQGRIGCR
jgi:hypothetical protein